MKNLSNFSQLLRILNERFLQHELESSIGSSSASIMLNLWVWVSLKSSVFGLHRWWTSLHKRLIQQSVPSNMSSEKVRKIYKIKSLNVFRGNTY